MKKLTLNQVNLDIIDGNSALNSGCDFCGEFVLEKLIVGNKPFKYWSGYDKKDAPEREYRSLICFDCIKQLAKLIEIK